MRLTLSTCPLLFACLMLAACPAKDKPAPGGDEAPAKAVKEPAPSPAAAEPATPDTPAEPAKAALPPPPAEIKPISMGKLKEEPLAEVVKKLTTAHYDPELLGLRKLKGTVTFTSARTKTHAEGQVSWESGAAPKVVLKRVEKDGKEIAPPQQGNVDDVGKAVGWGDLEYRVVKLVEGLSNGFLAQRLSEWRGSKGETKLRSDSLSLVMDQGEQGTVTVKVGEGYAVRKIEAAHPKGFTRAMEYTVQMDEGRNLVTSALVKTSIKEGVTLHKRAEFTLKVLHGTRFEIGYSKVGRFMLPVKLQKIIPEQKEEVTLVITYDKAE